MVQGEVMENSVQFYKKQKFPAIRLFLAGFLLGSFLPNMMWKMNWYQNTAASMYLIGMFADRSMSNLEYLMYILRMRGGYVLLAAVCGISVFGVPLAVVGMLGLGLKLGCLLTLSVLQFGIKGGAVSLGLLFPQYCLYIPAIVLMMSLVYQESMELWKNRGLFPKKISGYVLWFLAIFLLYLVGVFAEAYCNPIITEMLTKSLKIF